MAIAATLDVSEVTVHPNEDGNDDLFMFFIEFVDGQEHILYVIGDKCKCPKFRAEIIQSLLPEASL